MLVPTHEESPGIGDTRDRTDVTSIRIPSATSTISASFMQYTVSVAGATLLSHQAHLTPVGADLQCPEGTRGTSLH